MALNPLGRLRGQPGLDRRVLHRRGAAWPRPSERCGASRRGARRLHRARHWPAHISARVGRGHRARHRCRRAGQLPRCWLRYPQRHRRLRDRSTPPKARPRSPSSSASRARGLPAVFGVWAGSQAVSPYLAALCFGIRCRRDTPGRHRTFGLACAREWRAPRPVGLGLSLLSSVNLDDRRRRTV